MSKLGTLILAIAVLALGAVTAFLGLNAASQPFAIHMGIFVAACALFLAFIAKRAKFDSSQG
jgi:hypothetical protein